MAPQSPENTFVQSASGEEIAKAMLTLPVLGSLPYGVCQKPTLCRPAT